MDTGERLAAYLAGELDPEEVRRLEAELAREPALRTRLARLRRLEQALGAMPAVEVPAAFSQELHDVLQRELDGRPAGRDELAERRAAGSGRRRAFGGLPSWLPAAAGAAAVLVAVVVVGTSLPMGGSDDAGDGAETTALQGEAAEESAGDAGSARVTAADGPVVVSEGRSYDADDVQALVGSGELGMLAERALGEGEATELAERYRSAFEGSAGADTLAEDGDANEPAADEQSSPTSLRIEGSEEVHPEDLAAIAGCLDAILSESGPLIPVSAELARFDGTEAIVLGMVGHDPATGAFTRSELWVVARDTCEVLFFAQGGSD